MNDDLQNDRIDSGDELDLRHYWEVIRKHRIIIVACVAGALVLAIVATVMMKPAYRATVTLHVEPQTPAAFDIGESAAYRRTDAEFLPTQIELIQSRQMAERVVEKLDLVGASQGKPEKSGFFSWLTGDDGGQPVEVREKMVVKLARDLQGSVSATPVRGTNMIEVSVVAGDPEQSARIANALAESYIDWNLESKFAVLGQASRFLGTQIEQLKGEIQQKERDLQIYGLDKDILSTGSGNITIQNLEQVNKDYTAAVADRVSKEATYQELRNAASETIADTVSGGLVSQLRNEQIRLEREYAEKLNLFKPEWPAMQQLKAQIDEGKQHLNRVVGESARKARDQARNEYLTALRREQSLKAVLEGQKSEARTQSSAAVEYNNLRTEVETKRALLDTLLERQAETDVSSRLSGERVSSVRVVDRAVPPSFRYRPSFRRNARTGILMGLVLGVGIAFLRDYLDRSLRNAEQVEQYLRLPAIGAIPSLQQAQGALYAYSNRKRKVAKKVLTDEEIELLPHRKPHSTAAEAYRAVRTSLLLSRAGGLKSITVSSALPGEGKTVTSANLAVVLSQLGKRTLLIDADLHKPRMHKVFKVSNRHGVVSILAEGDDPGEHVAQTRIPHLDLLTSGPTSPNPSALLSSPVMKELLTWAHTHYEYVLIDTPPLSPITDAVILGTLTDGLVLAVKAGETPRDVVAAARDKLVRSNVRILGVVLNNLQLSADEYYYYASYYGEDKEASVARAG